MNHILQTQDTGVIRSLTTDYIELDTEAKALCEALDIRPPPPAADPRHATLAAIYRETATLARHISRVPARDISAIRLKADVGIRELESSAGTESTVALSALRDILALDSTGLCS